MSKGEKRSRMPVHKKAEKAHQKNTSPPLFVVGQTASKINVEKSDCFRRNGYNGQNEEKEGKNR